MVQYAFVLLWAGTSGVAVMIIPGTRGDHLPGTGYCRVHGAESYVPLAYFMPAIFDSLVFFAISYKIAFRHNQALGSESNWVRAWFSSRSLPVVSRAVLQGGQQYYLSVFSHRTFFFRILIQTKSITFGFSILSGAFSFNSSVPSMHHVLFSAPAVVLSACMACRAHRFMVATCNPNKMAPPLLAHFAAVNSGSVVSHTIVAVGVEKAVLSDGGDRL